MSSRDEEIKAFYKTLYGGEVTEFETAQRKWEAKFEEIEPLEQKYDLTIKGVYYQTHNAEDVKKAGQALYDAKQQLKELDLLCHELKGIDLNK